MSKMQFRLKMLMVASLITSVAVPIVPVSAANQTTTVKQDQHQLPIAQVFPKSGATGVRPDTPIQLVLDTNAPTYNRFREQFAQGFFALTLNGQSVNGTYDDTTHTVTLAPLTLNRYTQYTLTLTEKAVKNSDTTQSGNASYTTVFTTGSALHEATHLSTKVEQPQVLVTDGGKLDVQVTDDYGLPATNATIHVTGNSSTFQTADLTLTTNDNGQGVLPLNDPVKELVNLLVTAADNTYHDSNDANTANGTEQFLAGPPDHLTVQSSTPLTVGKSEDVTGTVYDKFGNTVEDTTLVTATLTSGQLAPQQTNTQNGTYDFVFTAPTQVQDVRITATSGQATGTTTVHLLPDQPAKILTQTDKTILLADGHATSTTTVMVVDEYGNPIPNAVISVASSGQANVPATITTDQNGQALLPVTDGTAETITITLTTANGVSTVVNLQACAPISTSNVVTWQAVVQDDGSFLISGTVYDEFGHKCPGLIIPINVFGGTVSTVQPISDGDGNFSFVYYPGGSGGMISLQQSDNNPILYFPGSLGSSWLDTGIELHGEQVIYVGANGGLEAQIGGTVIPIGGGGISTGSGGTLYLRSGGGEINNSVIYLEDACDHIAPQMTLTADPSTLDADGHSTSTIHGTLYEVSKAYVNENILAPVVGATITLSLPMGDGSLTEVQVVTDSNGNFSTTYVAGTTPGSVPVLATWGTISKSVNVTLQSVSEPLQGMCGSGAVSATDYVLSGTWTQTNYGSVTTNGSALSKNVSYTDGTVEETVQLSANSTGYTGVSVLDNGNGTGYLAYLQANGTVGIINRYNGQTVATADAGVNPTTDLVKFKVTTSGSNVSIAVNDEPMISAVMSYYGVGGVRLVNQNATTTYNCVIINALTPDWTQVNYDDSQWGGITWEGKWGVGPWGGIRGWTDPNAEWFWTMSANVAAPVGTARFRNLFMLDDTTNLKISATGDNIFVLYVDGQQLIYQPSYVTSGGYGWNGTYTKTIQLPPGRHVVAIENSNLNPNGGLNGGSPNPAGLLVSVVNADTGQVIFDNHTNSNWKTSGYLAY